MMPRGPRILYVTEALYRGGTEGHLAQIAPALKALGWDVSISCLSDVGPLAATLEQQGVSVIGPPVSQLSKRSWLFPFRIALAAVRLSWTVLRQRPSIVHCLLPGPYLVGGPIALAAGVPVRVMSRRSLNVYQQNWPVARTLEPALHRRMTAILANSRRIVRELVEDEGCDPNRVGLIYNGVDLATYQAARPADLAAILGSAKPELVLIIVANLIPYKGHADLLEALASVADRLPQPWTVLCVGRDFGIGEALKEQARRLGIADHVAFLGERQDVAPLLRAADIALLCSHQEGFANVILEAMAAGLPVIATDVGGNAESVLNGTTGLIVPPRDPNRLGEAILSLAGDAAKRRAMGDAGRRRVATQFSLETCVDRYDRLYRALIEGQGVGDIEDVAAPHVGSIEGPQ